LNLKDKKMTQKKHSTEKRFGRSAEKPEKGIILKKKFVLDQKVFEEKTV